MLIVYATDRWDVDQWNLRVCPDVEAAKDYCARNHHITSDMWRSERGEEDFWRADKGNITFLIEPILVHNLGDSV